MTFDDLKFEPKRSGVRARAFFPNGYGASVVQSPTSYGGDEGLYELAVLFGDESVSDITYDTPITDDVCGWLSETAVSHLLARIEALPASRGDA